MFRCDLFTSVLVFFSCAIFNDSRVFANQERPNIVWIVVDDMSSHFGYQGEPLARTPHVDQLAREGIVFENAYATAPVCSTFRSAIITGMYQTAIGAHHHRSGRGRLKIQLPKDVITVPELFRQAGYYTCIADASGERNGKQDYNFSYDPKELYHGISYRDRKPNQPFFAQYHLRGGKLRNIPASYEEAKTGLNHQLVDRSKITLPPYYPDHPVVREDWAQYIDSVNYTDIEVGRILQRLRRDDVLKDSIIFFLTDHGISHARGKQFLYEEGIHIPFVIWSPKHFPKPKVRQEFIAHIDLAATSLDLAGIPIPDWMQAQSVFGGSEQMRPFVVSARDRCDETVDRIRSVRMGEWKYIRNSYPERPYLQPSNYKDSKPFMPILRELYREGKLNAAQSLQLQSRRPTEELYHLPSDPWEVNNVSDRDSMKEILVQLRGILEKWEIQSGDLGRIPEDDAMYDSDMEVATQRLKRKNPEAFQQYQKNIEVMKKWKSEGK